MGVRTGQQVSTSCRQGGGQAIQNNNNNGVSKRAVTCHVCIPHHITPTRS